MRAVLILSVSCLASSCGHCPAPQPPQVLQPVVKVLPPPVPPCSLPALPEPFRFADVVTVRPDGFLVSADGFRALGAQLAGRDAWIREAYECMLERGAIVAK